ncbi:MAG: FACT complex subunit spt16 [Cirrosporium novae-zelandiae]|nr:MAG: FACT complex subunit spt16 [Cirrosporium novae-zelandiae]
MADEIKIDSRTFQERLSHFVGQWKIDKRSGDVLFNGASSIVILMGKAEEAAQFQKNNAVHFWLLGYEFPATLFVITTEGMYIVTTAKKDLAKHLEPLKKGGKIPLEILVRNKDPEHNAKQFEKCLNIIKSAGKKVGILAKDTSSGPFADEWKKAFGEISKDVEEVDISAALSTAALSVKDESELRAMRNASLACSSLMTEYFVEEMSEILDEEKKVAHKDLAAKIDGKIDEKKFFSKVKRLPSDFDHQNLDWAYGPVIQSGGKYDLKLTAEPDGNNLKPGIIIAGMGLRYKTYASIMARTYLVDPNKSQEHNYKLLLAVHEAVLKDARDGAVAKDLYNKALGIIRTKNPDLERHFLKNIGAGVGIETRDSTLVLNAKNMRTLKDGMTLVITTGFTDLQNGSSTYSLFLADTIRVTLPSSEPAVFTKHAPFDLDSVSFFFEHDEEQPAPRKEKKDPKVGAIATKNITKSRLRAERTTQVDEGAEARRRDHQKELASKKQQEGLRLYSEATGNQNGVAQKKFKRFESYKREDQFPSRVKDLSIVVDQKNSTVVLPIFGRPVPFHINTIKNASSNNEGDFAHLRINFLSPGQGVGRKDDQPFEDASAHFVRSLTFRSKDMSRMEEIAQTISDMRKDAVRREQEKKEMEDVVEQDKLIEIRNRRPQRLPDLFVRPALEGKRVPGEVEIHQNGIRYQGPLRLDHRIDILFSNIKHLLFQPCAHELIVIIHIHLKTPIMLGKKKTKDIQFYREATEMQFDETGNRKRRHRYGDEEEFEAEQEERRRRGVLDREFKAFADKIADAGKDHSVGVDIPFRDLAFNGVPFRSNVLVQPSTDCLVQLTEPPFTVVTLNEIEVAHLERVQFGLKNFDMVIVFKDYHRPPVHINTIPVESLENVKEWLDSVDIPFTEGPLNLNWSMIMKTVTADPHQFFKDGGWSFLTAESDSEDAESEEEESAFEMSESELAESDESSEDESDFDDDASAEASEDGSDVDDESGGEDWDELEKKAKKKDMEGGLDDDDEDRSRGRKRKR